jgi:hypothetical protein
MTQPGSPRDVWVAAAIGAVLGTLCGVAYLSRAGSTPFSLDWLICWLFCFFGGFLGFLAGLQISHRRQRRFWALGIFCYLLSFGPAAAIFEDYPLVSPLGVTIYAPVFVLHEYPGLKEGIEVYRNLWLEFGHWIRRGGWQNVIPSRIPRLLFGPM